MGKKEFTTAALDLEYKAFEVHAAALSVDSDDEVHPSKGAQIAYLKADKTPIEVPNEYADFADVFSLKLAAKLPEHRTSNHTIKLVDDQQPLYSLIYSLGPIKLEILKAYIKNNLINGFIRPFKSPTGAPISLDKKPDSSLRLYVNYQRLNNLTIKNQYPLPLVKELLN